MTKLHVELLDKVTSTWIKICILNGGTYAPFEKSMANVPIGENKIFYGEDGSVIRIHEIVESNIAIDTNNSLCIESNSKVINPQAVVVKRNGAVVGTVSAEYDFSQLPPEQHESVFNLIAITQVIHDCT